MNNLWCQANVGHLGKPELWKPTIIHQLETIEANLRLLPAGLYYQTERFDMLMLPNQRHGFGDMNEYFYWRLVDYFSEHLKGQSEKSVDIPKR